MNSLMVHTACQDTGPHFFPMEPYARCQGTPGQGGHSILPQMPYLHMSVHPYLKGFPDEFP